MKNRSAFVARKKLSTEWWTDQNIISICCCRCYCVEEWIINLDCFFGENSLTACVIHMYSSVQLVRSHYVRNVSSPSVIRFLVNSKMFNYVWWPQSRLRVVDLKETDQYFNMSIYQNGNTLLIFCKWINSFIYIFLDKLYSETSVGYVCIISMISIQLPYITT